jgi:hypothetical protein
MMDRSLTFAALREANMRRMPTFRNAQGELSHSMADGSDWSLNDWFTALTGECGELEETLPGPGLPGDARLIADEMADVAIYLDILAYQVGADMTAAIGLYVSPGPQSTTFAPPALSYGTLRRLTAFASSGRPIPTHPDGTPWTVGDQSAAMLGRVGLLGNTLKKMRRGDYGGDNPIKEVHGRLAAILIHLDGMAFRLGVDLSAAIVRKFNATSRKVGSPVMLVGEGTEP